jgi:hypothetical protein
MRTTALLLASIIATSTAMAAGETTTAQGMQGHMGSGMMPGTEQQPTDHGMIQDGMGHAMMCPMMQSGMMQGGMMRQGMMGSGMRGGMDALFGSRVTPVMNLSVDDVRGYLASQLERLNNKRLKVGNINSGDGTITADVVTVDNSLVHRHGPPRIDLLGWRRKQKAQAVA